MSLQFLVDGTVAGATIGLGAIGVTLTYSILRFANFAHGEFIAWGAYATLAASAAMGLLVGHATPPLGPFSFTWLTLCAAVIAMGFTGGLALGLDWLLFRRLRDKGESIIAIMASFGASMALRSLLEALFTAQPTYFTRALQIARPLGFGLRATPNQMVLVVLAGLLMIGVHLFMTRTATGRGMRAVSENPTLARVAGIDVTRVIRITWMIGGALACASGVVVGLLVQVRPFMGFDLLLPLFAAAILGGIGSVPGAVVGGFTVGLAEAAAVAFVGAQWRGAVAFAVLIAVLLVKPAGLFGRRA
ncbi:branched-chain amino acid ABC transporter permease [Lichenifustis flavocetrariae]|uniref:Branched-chain amino acid ABC transporter permease n=1 Tax=Lichenifustis flavocetrariae TaxID=2949735 RepID=A0AA42CKY5_9HYPH|nr:branched-chain amino acid ABC transporter permease [Lichenifustis flavocetrariae]MCW6506770.1 branched-chain amino acid ABC transporter permease [Lichenifustis flavocetrariae]